MLVVDALIPVYARRDLAFISGEGCWLVTKDGRRFLDFASGIAVSSLGHSHPALVHALTDQAQRLWHCSNMYTIPSQQQLAEKLVSLSFADSTFFCNSGAEAIEGAIKITRRFYDSLGYSERRHIIVATGAFHGRTLAASAASASEKVRLGFDPLPPGFDRVPFGDISAMKDAITAKTAAILIEPIQGEGGVRLISDETLRDMRALSKEAGILLIVDEVQCGVGRTGRLWAHEWAGIEPDIMTIAKGLGGGFPIGAVLVKAPIAAAMTSGSHGTTFGGNLLANVVGLTVIDIVSQPSFLEHIRCVADKLDSELNALCACHPTIFCEARGRGLMRGLVCGPPVHEVRAKIEAEGLLIAPASDNVIRILPPLIVRDDEIDEAIKALHHAADALAMSMPPVHVHA